MSSLSEAFRDDIWREIRAGRDRRGVELGIAELGFEETLTGDFSRVLRRGVEGREQERNEPIRGAKIYSHPIVVTVELIKGLQRVGFGYSFGPSVSPTRSRKVGLG